MVLNKFCTSIKLRRQKTAVKEYNNYVKYLTAQQEGDLITVKENLNDDVEKQKHQKQQHDKWLSVASLAVNLLMVAAKSIAAYLSNSMSITSALVDSVMDITCGTVVYVCVRKIQRTNAYEYPIGRNRLEPVSILIVSVIMVMANLFVVFETAMSIINHTLKPVVTIIVLVVMIVGTGLKVLLLIFCRKYDSPNSRLLGLDQRNDILTNIVALAGAFIGHRFWIYADPIGAFFVCAFVVLTWLQSAKVQIPLLVSKVAKPEFISRIMTIAIHHDTRIESIETLTVYHLGSKFLAELHVIMPDDMLLREAHDIAAQLQLKLEKLPYVERAFVHCDYDKEEIEHLNQRR